MLGYIKAAGIILGIVIGGCIAITLTGIGTLIGFLPFAGNCWVNMRRAYKHA